MKIVYIARHDQPNSNDDEGAITHALTELGHKVTRLWESNGRKAHRVGADLVLFHKWYDPEYLKRLKTPKVFWYFDLVDYPGDPSLSTRCKQRVTWMESIVPRVDLGFCTDGDWVVNYNRKHSVNKLVWLAQGADSRLTGFGENHSRCVLCHRPDEPRLVTFIGSAHGGAHRQSFVHWMQETYGPDFRHVSSGIHGRKLADLVASSKIIVAPDSPVTDLYWSNRVYLMLGFGAFLLHPLCTQLCSQYVPYRDLILYNDREHLKRLIEYYKVSPTTRAEVSRSGYERTLAAHTYKHRCEELIRVVEERLFNGADPGP